MSGEAAPGNRMFVCVVQGCQLQPVLLQAAGTGSATQSCSRKALWDWQDPCLGQVAPSCCSWKNLHGFQKPIHTTLLSKPSLWVQEAVSGWCSFGQVLAPGLLTFNAREGSLRHRFHRKLFISGSKAVYPRANKSGSTSLSL